ncbi:MAG: divalent-cation tolerance protein CutA [Scytolyngbya sp. HA4215-MV1]|jgi:periplasmic divalent cation tolerance protein|nr:divalent-cation tolerance protein CutA [Scytolyngbya sp. HA4215-MV1]
MTETTQYGVILVTASSQAEAIAIARALVQEKLAACVTLLPVHSIYTWQHEVHEAEEWQLLIKSEQGHFAVLERRIREIHSYEVPEVILLPVLAGSLPYLQWISEQVNPASDK